MGKSIVSTYYGGRGSGKTLSMSVDGSLAMIAGKNVWSNYPLKVAYKDDKGEIHAHHSIKIDMPDLIQIQGNDTIRDGIVLLDEWNLFCNARRSGAMSNIIFSGIVQLIRKRKLSFYITTQDFMTLDRNIRFQCDLAIECFDLSFKYHNLPEGQVISQRILDRSGIFTGRALYDKDKIDAYIRNTRTRLLTNGKTWWGCYDTGFEYNVLEVMSQRYSLARQDNIVEVNGGTGFRGELLTEALGNLKQSMPDGGKRISRDEMEAYFQVNYPEIKGDFRGELGKQIKASGFVYKQSRKGNYYELAEG